MRIGRILGHLIFSLIYKAHMFTVLFIPDPVDANIREQWYQNFIDVLSDFEHVFNLEFVPILKSSFAETFRDQGRPNRWARLSPKYLEWKIRHGYPADIGILTGAMFGDLTKGRGVYKTSSFELVYGTELPYADYFHSGTTRQPARPLILIFPEDIEAMLKALEKYIMEAIW